MIEVRRTQEFIDWLNGLKDVQGRARIAKRIDRVRQGNFGDVAPVGEGVSELRFMFGPGYRVYFVTREQTIVILLCGGDKSTQVADIARAKEMAKEIE